MPLYVIRGGGIAGQVLQKELSRRGIASHLKDTVSFPRDKVCGGVLQWDSWEYLRSVFSTGEPEREIYAISHFWRGKKISTINLRKPMVYISRLKLDDNLSVDNRAGKTESASSDIIEIIASGAGRQEGKWIGFQCQGRPVTELEMHYGRGIYAGVSPNSADHSHVAFLVRHDLLKNPTNLVNLIQKELRLDIEPPLKGTGRIRYSYSDQRQAIGDAKLTTHPFLGFGMKHAILSARLMADLIEKGRIGDYDLEHRRQFKKYDHISSWACEIYESPFRSLFLPFLKSPTLFQLAFEWIHV